MKAAALLALLLWQVAPADRPPVAEPGAMRYERAISLPPGAGQACAVLDAQIFSHAGPSLTDLRIFPLQAATPHEVPYAITLSEAVTQETSPARLLNLGLAGDAADAHGASIVFDLQMPDRPYTDVVLDLDPALHDFLATATVTASNALGSGAGSTALGSFTLFDLTAQHLSRSTTLPLEESTFRYLHIVLRVSPAPGASVSQQFVPAMVEGAEVPPSREAQTVYTTVAETASITPSGRESVAHFVVPRRVPIERVAFELAPGFKGNFSRDVRVTATAEPPAKGEAAEDSSQGDEAEAGMENDGRAALPEVVTGNILRVHATEAGREIRTEQLDIPAILGANLQRPAKVEVAVENGDDQPLPIASVRLEMRQRRLCFDAAYAANSSLALFYGDPKLLAPVYDYDRLFVASIKPLIAQLGPEMPNPNYRPPADNRPFTERHPQVLWVALIVVISALGVVALKSARNVC